MSDNHVGSFVDGLSRVKELVQIGSAPSNPQVPGTKKQESSSSLLPSLLSNPKVVLGGLGFCATMYFAYKLWPSRTPDPKLGMGRPRRSSSGARSSRASSRVSFPCSPIHEFVYSSSEDESDPEPPAFRNGFSTDPNYTPNSPFKKYKAKGWNNKLKSKDSQFYALFNYVGTNNESNAADVINVPAAAHPEPMSFPGGGSAAPANVMRELPQNMSMPPQPKVAEEPNPAFKTNHRSTLELLKERYQAGELPPRLMKQTSVERSFNLISQRHKSPQKGGGQDQNRMPFVAQPGAAPPVHVEEVLDIGEVAPVV